jgi:hypothetical protein
VTHLAYSDTNEDVLLATDEALSVLDDHDDCDGTGG